ncbi:MAG TPA: pirin-like C-terminal cupin domain-containing protein, partial [Kribbella sp.]
ALPDSVRTTTPPAFNAYADLPRLDLDGGAQATVMIGTVAGVTSPAPAFTPLVGADITIPASGTLALPLTPSNEYAVLVVDGSLSVGDLHPGFGEMVYLGANRESIDLVASDNGVRFLLLGGEPFEEQLVMWWNFIGRSHEEIVAAREAWQSAISTAGNDRFRMVPGYDGDPLPAPPLPATTLKPRPRAR